MIWIFVLLVILGVAFVYLKKRPKPDITYSVSISTESSSLDNDSYSESDDADQYNEDDQYNDNYWIPVESLKRKVSASVAIKYQKTNKEIHERDFDISSFSRGEKGYHIHGYCHRRKRNITLSSIGVIEAIDKESGNVIPELNHQLSW